MTKKAGNLEIRLCTKLNTRHGKTNIQTMMYQIDDIGDMTWKGKHTDNDALNWIHGLKRQTYKQ